MSNSVEKMKDCAMGRILNWNDKDIIQQNVDIKVTDI